MVRAAVRGVIDFRRADLRSVQWWRRTHFLLEEVSREDSLAVTNAAYQLHLALVANGSLSEDGFKAEQKKAHKAFQEIVSSTHPWAARVRKQRQLEDAKYLRELYIKVCGDPDDPVVRERWKRESEALEAQLNQPDPVADMLAAVARANTTAKAKAAAVSLD